jgi:hypothetical protein
MPNSLLFFLLILPLSAFSHSEGPVQTYLDLLNAEKMVKSREDFKIQGAAVRVMEINGKDTLRMDFNASGLLERSYDTRTSILTTFAFENNALKSIIENELRYQTKTTTFFGKNGYCEKVIVDDQNNDFHSTAHYNFNDTFDELEIKYSYNIDANSRDVVLNNRYTFTRNDKQQVIKERCESTHKEWTYGTTVTYAYDSIGNIVHSTDIADCALSLSSNSCRYHIINVVFDERNNIISKSLSDLTIRNSLWSNSYIYTAIYNEHNDVVEEQSNRDFDALQYIFLSDGPHTALADDPSLKPFFEYDYDSQGNWVVKYLNHKGERTVAGRREIW